MFRKWAAALLLAAGAHAAPPLTTIQDVIYRADGSPFRGTIFVEWRSFEAVDASLIATHSVAVPVINGVLRVQLVPTTNAAHAAVYLARYNSDGRIQFEETWAVPPSSVPLKLSSVRIATVTSPGAVTPPPTLEIADVPGLAEELASRPVKSPGFAPSRAVYADATGALAAVTGDPSDCVRVDGSSGPCAAGDAVPGFVDGETPAGNIDGVNGTFTLTAQPSPPESLSLYRNGLLQKAGVDYTLSGATIEFVPAAVPHTGDLLTAAYRTSAANGVQGGALMGAYTDPAPAVPQLICGGTGAGTNGTAAVRLGSCTIPGGLLKAGDRVELSFDYEHTGTGASAIVEVRWGATNVLSRAVAASDALMTGRVSAGVHGSGVIWSVQSWGGNAVFSAASGSAGDSLASALTIDFLGRMSATGTDVIALRGFTVVRYPAQANP